MAVMVSVRSVFLLLFMCAFGLAHRLQGVHQSGLAPQNKQFPVLYEVFRSESVHFIPFQGHIWIYLLGFVD